MPRWRRTDVEALAALIERFGVSQVIAKAEAAPVRRRQAGRPPSNRNNAFGVWVAIEYLRRRKGLSVLAASKELAAACRQRIHPAKGLGASSLTKAHTEAAAFLQVSPEMRALCEQHVDHALRTLGEDDLALPYRLHGSAAGPWAFVMLRKK